MSEKTRKGGWTQTFTGKQFWPLDPRPEDVEIVDIAHALAAVNRYNGHTPKPYSVAQHSVLVSHYCLPQDAFWGLMHDASEAYIGDMISPMKRFIPDYQQAERNLMNAICRKFWMDPTQPASVGVADLEVLAAEARDFFPVASRPMSWGLPFPPPAGLKTIVPMEPKAAEVYFTRRFNELWPKHIRKVRAELRKMKP